MSSDIGNPFMEVVTKKIEKQDERIDGLEQQMKNLPDNTKEKIEIKNAAEEVTSAIKIFPVKEMHLLSANLVTVSAALKQPVEQKNKHYHYLDKAFLIAGILFLVVAVLGGLYSNALARISQNRESNIKYRYLKLYKNENLRKIILQVDSIYLADAEQMCKEVIEEEEWRKEQAELLLESKEKELEAKRLKEKAMRK